MRTVLVIVAVFCFVTAAVTTPARFAFRIQWLGMAFLGMALLL